MHTEKKSSDLKKNYYTPRAAEGIYRANLDALEARQGGLGVAIEKLLAPIEERPIAIEDTIGVQGLKNPTTLVIMGFATRKVLEAARRSKKEIHQVIIIEPSYAVFKQTLRREYVADLIRDDLIEFVVGVPIDELQTQLFKIFAKADIKHGPRASKLFAPEIITDPFIYPLDNTALKAETDKIAKAVVEAKNQLFLSMGCSSDSFNRWEQMVRNIPNIQSGYRIEPLFKRFSGMPFVVVGAGPSMQDFISEYHRIGMDDKAVIIACDASLKRLLKEGIRPHLVTRCERKFTTIFSGVKKEDTKDIFYAAYPWCAKEYFDLFQDFFMMFRGNGVCKWTGYNPGEVNGGVSSANAALELAFLMGAGTIVLTGIDLCFLGGQSHVGGTEVEFDPEKSKPKWEQIEANDGSIQTTIPIWKRCHSEYRGTLFRYSTSSVKVFNASHQGAKIHGAQYKSWAELGPVFGGKLEIVPRIRQALDKHGSNYDAALLEKKARSIACLQEVQHDLQKLFLSVNDAMINLRREEAKQVDGLRLVFEPREFFNTVEAMKKGLVGIFTEPARQIDQWKGKWYVNPLFNELILDQCQLDFYQAENRMHSLKNILAIDHERLKAYVGLHMGLFKVFEFYVGQMLQLFVSGSSPIKDDETEDFLDAEAKVEWD